MCVCACTVPYIVTSVASVFPFFRSFSPIRTRCSLRLSFYCEMPLFMWPVTMDRFIYVFCCRFFICFVLLHSVVARIIFIAISLCFCAQWRCARRRYIIRKFVAYFVFVQCFTLTMPFDLWAKRLWKFIIGYFGGCFRGKVIAPSRRTIQNASPQPHT